jgi:hypothetical protein
MGFFDLNQVRPGNQLGGRWFIGRKEERPVGHIDPSDQETHPCEPMWPTVPWVNVKDAETCPRGRFAPDAGTK